MAVKLDDIALAQLCEEFNYHVPSIVQAIRERYDDYIVRSDRITKRVNKLRERGILPLDSGNYVSSGEILKGSSTLYDEDGNIKLQWVKTDVEKESQTEALRELVENLIEDLPKFKKKPFEKSFTSKDLMAIYPLGDPHVGMKAYKDEAGDDWDLKTAQEVFCGVFDRLVKTAPSCDQAVIVNLVTTSIETM
jgi:hypothetical protein